MTRSYLLSLVAGSMALFGMATTSVQAQQSDLNSLILNGVISSLLNQGNNSNSQQNSPLGQLGILEGLLGAQPQSRQLTPQALLNNQLNPYNSAQGQLRPRQDTRSILPAACLQQVRTSAGTVQVFGQNCLQHNYRHTASLPRDCAVRVNNSRDLRNAYDAYCLRQAGYRVSGR